MTDRSHISALLALLLGLVVAGGCGGAAAARGPTPEQILHTYAKALARGDADAAYALMAPSFRKKVSREAFARMVRSDPRWTRRVAARIRAGSGQVRHHAELTLEGGETVKLVREGKGWRLAQNPTDIYGQSTPEEALRSFVRAVERKRWDIVLRFVPRRWAKKMTAQTIKSRWEGEKQDEVKRLLEQLKSNLGSPIHRTGSRATMAFGDASEITFVREDGLWKVVDAH